MPTPVPFSIQALAPYADDVNAHAAAEDSASGASVIQNKKKPSLWPAALSTIAGNAADTISTWDALSSGRAHEGNPMLPKSPAAIAGVKAAMTVPELLLEKKLNDSGHSTAAKVLGLAIGGLGAGIAMRNSRVGK